MPVRLFLLLPTGAGPLSARCDRQRCDAGAVIRAAHLGIGTQVPDQDDFIETAAHNNLRRLCRSGSKGCPTLYKSQVILSIKDTPLVPKLCITSQDDGILRRPPVVLLPATRLLEPMGGIERASRCVRLAHLEVDLPNVAFG